MSAAPRKIERLDLRGTDHKKFFAEQVEPSVLVKDLVEALRKYGEYSWNLTDIEVWLVSHEGQRQLNLTRQLSQENVKSGDKVEIALRPIPRPVQGANQKIFLSYSSKDKAQVRQLAVDLRRSGVAVWLDEWEIFAGDSIIQKMQAGLDECQLLAVWLTRHSVSSGWVQREWHSQLVQETQSGITRVLPLLAEECEVPVFLREKKFADFRYSYANGLAELLDSLRRSMPIIDHSPNDRDRDLFLEYFSIDPGMSTYKVEYLKSERRDLWHLKEAFGWPVEEIYRPGTPVFKPTRWGEEDEYPIFLMTVFNGSVRKLLLHTLLVEVLAISPYAGGGDTEILQPLAAYDVEVPAKVGMSEVAMAPQIAIAAGDLASFHIRLTPPPMEREFRTLKDYSINLKILGSRGASVESGVFHVDLLT